MQPGSSERHNAYGTVAEVIDANHYGVMLNWGQRIEAVDYWPDEVLSIGDRVFLQPLRQSNLWAIIGQTTNA